MMIKLCAGVFWLYVAAAALALAVALVSKLGLFGAQPSPLGPIFAVLLAEPWVSLAPDFAGADGFASGLALICVCLALNAALLRLICRLLRG